MAKSNLEIIVGLTDNTKRGLGSITGALGKLGKVAAGVALGGVTALAGGLTALAVTSIPAASDLEESINKVNVVFGDASDAVHKFAADAAIGLGQSRAQALDAAGTYGNLLTSIGLATDQAADMSIQMVTLASDLASFNNASPEETILALRSALTGEFEPMKRFGAALNQAAVEAKALELGLIGTKDELTPAIKAQAAYALILEQTTNAQGDFARTSEGLANAQRVVKAQMQDLRATIGKFLLPVAEKFFGFLSKTAIPSLKNIIDLLATGDFKGGIFGLMEDHPFIEFLLRIRRFVVDFVTLINVVREFGIESETARLALENMFGSRFVATIFKIRDAIMSVFEVVRLLITGDFRGGIFGMFEDSGFIDALFRIREVVTSVYEAVRLLITGDFRGGIFGMFEDDAFISALLNIRDGFISTKDAVIELAGRFADFVANVVAPFIDEHGDQLVGILAGIVTGLAAFSIISTVVGWITGLIAAVSAAGTAIGAAGGIIGAIVAILGGPLTIAIAAVAALIGLFVAAWVNDWGNIREITGNVVNAITGFWSNTLLPALQSVWQFLSVDMMPVWEALWELLQVAGGLALEILSGLWQNVLLPALQGVWAFIENNLLPTFSSLWQFIQNRIIPIFQSFGQTVGGLSGLISTVVGWINGLAQAIRNLPSQLPSWLRRQSPSPFELVFINSEAALKSLNQQLPKLKASLDFGALSGGMGTGALAMAGQTVVGGNTTINQHFYDEGSAALGLALTRKAARDRLNGSMGR